jgi:hypothetical protein
MTRFRTSRLGRLVRGRRLDRNPLRRACDRAETVVLGALIAGFLAAAPFAAHAAGNWAYAASAREALTRSQLSARAELAAELIIGALAIVLAGAGWLTRRVLDRRRMAAWDADWLATAPRWSPRR